MHCGAIQEKRAKSTWKRNFSSSYHILAGGSNPFHLAGVVVASCKAPLEPFRGTLWHEVAPCKLGSEQSF